MRSVDGVQEIKEDAMEEVDRRIGDLLDCEKEYRYPRSDGSEIWTIDCRAVYAAGGEDALKEVGVKLQELTHLVTLPNEVEISVVYHEDFLRFIVALCEGRMP